MNDHNTDESSIAEIDLNAISHNLGIIRAHISEAALCAVVKSNAYGHGLLEVGTTLAADGADWLAVATVQEGMSLRAAGVACPILILRYIDERQVNTLVHGDLTPVVYDQSQIAGLARSGSSRPLNIHLNIDTGMGRMGVRPYELGAFLRQLASAPNLHLDGVMTHFANADLVDSRSNAQQMDSFASALHELAAQGHEPRWVHASNSAASLTAPAAYFNMVRPGLALYGINPLQSGEQYELRPAMRWTTNAIQVRTISEGTSVSYGWLWTAARASTIATLPVGYADGYSRAMTGQAQVLVRGKRVPVIGAICMDFCMIDVSDIEDFTVSDEVVLLGSQDSNEISAYDLATWRNSIPYEVICSLGDRVKRRYKKV